MNIFSDKERSSTLENTDEGTNEEADELQLPDAESTTGPHDPEITDPQLDEVETWDEPEGLAGYRVPPVEAEDEALADEELTEEGLEVAEDELRDEEEFQQDLEDKES